MVKCAALLLAAGKSTRMGRLKALLPWEGTTLFQHQLAQLSGSLVNTVTIVLGYHSSKLLPYLKDSEAKFILNEKVELGKTESIKKGLSSIEEDIDCLIITSVDQPVNTSLINEMIHQFIKTKSKIIIPIYDGKRGHPILFSAALRDELFKITEETCGLKAIIHRWQEEINELKVADPSILFNFNSPNDYEKAISKGGYHHASD